MRLAPIAILIGGAVTGADRPRGVQFIEMGISFLGAGFVITRCDLTTVFGGQLNLGDLVMLLNVTIWAIYSLLLRRRPADLPQDVTLAGSMLAGLVLLLPFVVASGPVEWHRAGSCARDRLMALFASVLAFMFWSLGVTRLGSARSGQFINLMPVFGVILASLVLRKIRRPAEMIGAATRLDRDSQRRVGTSIGLMAFSVALQLLWPFSDLRAVVDARLLLTRDRPTSREVRSFY